MPRIPRPIRTISQLVESQLPAFVRESDPQFVAFLKAYYEWLETNGADVFTCKIVASDPNSVTLTPDASVVVNAYQGMNLVVLNGPAKGNNRRISTYDPYNKVVRFDLPWDTNIPPANSLVVVRDRIYPDKLIEYRDIDDSLDRFIQYFENEFLYDLPGNLLADKRNILKRIKEFYQARGTENSFRFLFRIMFGEELEFYYPKVDLFRASDAHWYVENYMRITTTGDTFDYLNRQLEGVSSGTTAKVESVKHTFVAGHTITDLTLSAIDGTFTLDPDTNEPELVKIVYPFVPPPQSDLGDSADLLEPGRITKWEQTYQILQGLTITAPGDSYAVGDRIAITGGGGLAPASAVVTAVKLTYFNGVASAPPTTYYLEPYFGPDDFVNATGDPTQDGVCIPGMYYYSDVHSLYTENDLLKQNQIMLAQTETTTDDFFVGDQIALVGGSGTGDKRIITSYDGITKIATVDQPFSVFPDSTTVYSILHNRGGITGVKIVEFGLGFASTPTVSITSTLGTGGVLTPVLGIVAQTAGQWTAGRSGGIGGVSTTTDSFASSNKIIQDSYYWQDFSYDLRFAESIDKYRDAVKKLLHPAGMQMFGSVIIKSDPQTDFLKTLRQVIIDLDAQAISTHVEADTKTVVVLSEPAIVVGTRNKDFDAFKFVEFPLPKYGPGITLGFGNTQLGNLKDLVLGDIINNPDRRIKINADAIISTSNGNTTSRVGPIGQSMAAISRYAFIGFPPFEGFVQSYPSPNEGFWQNGFGDTQLSTFKDIHLSDLITDPENVRSNICLDADIEIYRNGEIPVIGDIVEYAFLPGMDPQIVYNVSPNAHGAYDAAVGSSVMTGADDPTWVTEGITFNSTTNQIINATGIPLGLEHLTVVWVGSVTSTNSTMTLVSNITDNTINGFSIDVQNSGGISFRAQCNGVTQKVEFPAGTITANTYFMATLRFDAGLLVGNVNNLGRKAAQFASYPANPTVNSDGWYFGLPSASYQAAGQPASLFGGMGFGRGKFDQASQAGSTVTTTYFDGTVAYALFYDRSVYDFELDYIYRQLGYLLQGRGINLPS